MTRAATWAAAAILALVSVCAAQPAMVPRLVAGQTLHGRFVQQRHLKGFAAPLTAEGNFVLVPGRGLIWRTERPIRILTVITPAGVRQIINGSEVQNIESARVPFLAHFYAMLNGALIGDWSSMRHDFALKLTGDRKAWQAVLTPRRPGDPIAALLSSIVISGGKLVESVDIDRANGDSEHLAFLDQEVSNVAPAPEDARLLDRGPAN